MTDPAAGARRDPGLVRLVRAGVLAPERTAALEAVARRHAVAVAPDLCALIDPADPADPVARQYVPDEAELTGRPEERGDPIGDAAHMPVEGLVHRYPDRVLLMPGAACAAYCRFCFRRTRVGTGAAALGPAELDACLDYIRARPAIWEVILSGGDPLVLAPRRLGALVAALDAISHVGVVRVHTRLPVVDPRRITPALTGALATTDSALWVAVHVNHPRELTAVALAAIRRLIDAGAALVSQTVLLRGVNDDPAVLEALFRALVRARVKPYYLHHADLAQGTGHFRTGIEDGRALMGALRGRVSGLCQPTYVLDLPGGHGKVPAGPCWLEGSDAAGWRAEAPGGGVHRYPPTAGEVSRADEAG